MRKKKANTVKTRNLVLTPAHHAAKQMFNLTGQSIAGWARKHNFPVNLVHEVLRGRNPRRGMSHQIAVLLGIKVGTITNDASSDGSAK